MSKGTLILGILAILLIGALISGGCYFITEIRAEHQLALDNEPADIKAARAQLRALCHATARYNLCKLDIHEYILLRDSNLLPIYN